MKDGLRDKALYISLRSHRLVQALESDDIQEAGEWASDIYQTVKEIYEEIFLKDDPSLTRKGSWTVDLDVTFDVVPDTRESAVDTARGLAGELGRNGYEVTLGKNYRKL